MSSHLDDNAGQTQSRSVKGFNTIDTNSTSLIQPYNAGSTPAELTQRNDA